ncbi:MAG TPA: transcription termination/antitermination protein NusA [Candidatus Avimonoglobus intestinipullorum]|uniref:Transcription termination/antitermination protein NusA n=1 Tax=Candidatus Avimonoglobus intestinipullorum TaxID=2840699 RepID=A0A9D1LUC0_9FIRM|nr:transcription termination/antitermination protein NusA [Candidatus Avimonoglobus intestinipullorum]
MNEELLRALEDLCAEKGIDRDVILDALEAALIAAYKRNFQSAQNVEVQMDRATGAVKVMAKKVVVETVSDEDAQEQISLEDARKISGQLQLGDEVNIEVTPKDFGRIAAMTAKQVITQRLREAERGIIYSEYTDKANDIVSGKVQRIERGNVFVDIGKIEAILPLNEQPEGETYQPQQWIKCYVSEVKNGTKGTQIVLSRTHPGLVKKLFMQEVPEIADGLVEIKSIAREAGSRTKIAVYSQDPEVDPQGACIGPKGTRVQRIGEELRDEKIDIVKWSEDPAEFIAASLSPSKVLSVTLDEEEKSAQVTVPEYQLSLAIGKAGQNVRLAARLTGWKIDITAAAE